MNSSIEIFFSYAWGDDKETGDSREKMINEIYDALQQEGYVVVRDKYDLGYTGQISKFMQRIGEGRFVIVGISDKYLKSEYCMYELLEIYRNARSKEDSFLNRIIPLRVEDQLSLKTPKGKQVYIDHWNKVIEEAEASVKLNPNTIGPKRIEWLKRYREIRNELDDLLELFSDINTLTKELLSQNNYQAIRKTLFNRIQEEAIKLSIQEKSKTTFTDAIENHFSENDLFEISSMDKEALVISVKEGKYVYFRSPQDMEQRYKYVVSPEKFSQQVTDILQRLLLEDNLKDNEFEILGTSLFQRLLPHKEAKAAFTAYVEQAVKTKIPLKIILRFDDASSQLACLPWEYLFCPLSDTSGLFVGESQELILTRRLSVKGNDQQIQTPELKVLIAVSAHLQSDATDGSDENELLKAIQEIPAYTNKKVSGELVYFASLNQLADFLLKQNSPYQVVHIFGLCRMQQTETHQKVFELALGDAFSIESKNLFWKTGTDLIASIPVKPSLIFLHAARNSAEDTYLAMSGFAFILLKEVPGVLALQAPPGNSNAITFARYFYKALIQDEADMDAAVKRSLGEIAFFKSKLPRVKVSSYSGKSLRFIFENQAPPTALTSTLTVKCKQVNDYAIRKGELCNNEIELIKHGDGDSATYSLQESDIKICKRCGHELVFCTYCGYMIQSPEDNFCGPCKRPILRKEQLQQQGMFDQRGSSSVQNPTLKQFN